MAELLVELYPSRGGETCFFLCAAVSAEGLRETARQAALPFERVAEAVAEPLRENE